MKPHLCVDCAALPIEQQPKAPRPAPHGGPRSKRCATHHRAIKQAQRIGRHTARVTRVYGLDRATQVELWELQGRRCPCGRQPSRMPDTDHDHALARQHDHPVNEGCVDCIRGMCCRACNSYVLGIYNADQLEALARYLRNPPMAQIRRQRLR